MLFGGWFSTLIVSKRKFGEKKGRERERRKEGNKQQYLVNFLLKAELLNLDRERDDPEDESETLRDLERGLSER